MKLIDLLVQELPKRGGWPEGAVECQRFIDESNIDFYDENANWDDDCLLTYGAIAAELVRKQVFPCEYEQVTFDEYQSALEASQKVEWDGVGLPPVGVECEWQDKNTKKWQPVKVVYASEWVTVIREINKEKGDDLVEIAIENYRGDARLKFRPTRTESERKRDDVKRAISELHDKDGYKLAACMIDPIYDAIAAGKIPGVKLED